MHTKKNKIKKQTKKKREYTQEFYEEREREKERGERSTTFWRMCAAFVYDEKQQSE